MRNVTLAILLALSITLLSACQKTEQSTTNSNSSNSSTATTNPTDPTAQASPGAPQQGMNQPGIAQQTDPTSSGVTPVDSSATSLAMLAMDFHNAILQGDKTRLETMLADDYKRTRLDGTIVNKTQELASAKKVEDMMSMEAQPAQIKGDSATVSGKISLTSKEMSGQKKGSWQTTDSFRKQGGRWLVVSSVEKKN